MSYESTAEPIRLGYLMDFKLPEGCTRRRACRHLVLPFEMVFELAALREGVLDSVRSNSCSGRWRGCRKASVKAVIDAYGELVDEGCLAVFGPHITDNCVPTREAIERRFEVPAISVTGSDEWLGEWTFSLPQGSLTDEPIFWADLVAKAGHAEVGALVEQSLVGETYIRNFRKACATHGIRIAAEEWIPQTAQDVTEQVRALFDAKVPAFVHCGFGFGLVHVNLALAELGWDHASLSRHRLQERVDPPDHVGCDFRLGPASTSTTSGIRSGRRFSTSTRSTPDGVPSTASPW